MSTLTAPEHSLVSPRVRTVVYMTALIVGALATAASTITAVVAPGSAQSVAAIGGAFAGLFATVSGGLGTAYRPGTGTESPTATTVPGPKAAPAAPAAVTTVPDTPDASPA